MKKVIGLLIAFSLFIGILAIMQTPIYAKKAAYKAPAGAMKGFEVGIGEYASWIGLDVKVLNWGFVLNPPAKYYTDQIEGKNRALMRIDLLFKNATDNPKHLSWDKLHAMLISKDERSFDIKSPLREYGEPQKFFSKSILPGQPLYASLYVVVDSDIIPAKLIIRAAYKKNVPVIRCFLQQNLPEEEIEGTSHTPPAVSPPESTSPSPPPQRQTAPGEKTFGQEVKESAEQAAKQEVKRKAAEETRKKVRKLLDF